LRQPTRPSSAIARSGNNLTTESNSHHHESFLQLYQLCCKSRVLFRSVLVLASIGGVRVIEVWLQGIGELRKNNCFSLCSVADVGVYL